MSKVSQALGINIDLRRLVPKAIQQAIVDEALAAAKPELINLTDAAVDTYLQPDTIKAAVASAIASWHIKV